MPLPPKLEGGGGAAAAAATYMDLITDELRINIVLFWYRLCVPRLSHLFPGR